MGSFTQKSIRTTITLRQGTFAGGNNTITIEGLATGATIVKPGGDDKTTLDLWIAGLPPDVMATATTLGFMPQQSQKNLILVEVGPNGGNMVKCFEGEFTLAWADYTGTPDVKFRVSAASGIYAALLPSKPTGIKGRADVTSLFQQFATEAEYVYQNQGVSGQISNTTINGSPIQKIYKLARMIDCEVFIENGTVTTIPSGANKTGNAVVISAETGGRGYPSFTQDGLEWSSIFDNNIDIGGLLDVRSEVPKASGIWKVTKVTHNLEAYTSATAAWNSTFSAVFVQNNQYS